MQCLLHKHDFLLIALTEEMFLVRLAPMILFSVFQQSLLC